MSLFFDDKLIIYSKKSVIYQIIKKIKSSILSHYNDTETKLTYCIIDVNLDHNIRKELSKEISDVFTRNRKKIIDEIEKLKDTINIKNK